MKSKYNAHKSPDAAKAAKSKVHGDRRPQQETRKTSNKQPNFSTSRNQATVTLVPYTSHSQRVTNYKEHSRHKRQQIKRSKEAKKRIREKTQGPSRFKPHAVSVEFRVGVPTGHAGELRVEPAPAPVQSPRSARGRVNVSKSSPLRTSVSPPVR